MRLLDARFVSCDSNTVTCRRSHKGPLVVVSYEEIEIVPKIDLGRDLIQGSLEDIIYSNDTTLIHSDEDPDDHVPRKSRCEFDDTELHKFMEISNSDGSGEDELTNICRLSPILASNENEDCSRDVGEIRLREDARPTHTEITSDRTKVLDALFYHIGTSQVNRCQLELVRSWLVISAIEDELSKSWGDAYSLVREWDVPRDENVIGSHFSYKIKVDESFKRLKARLCPHCNQDEGNGKIRKDYANKGLMVIRLLLSLASAMRFGLCTADVKRAYLQSGPNTRDLHVRPHPKTGRKGGMIWKQKKLSYGRGNGVNT